MMHVMIVVEHRRNVNEAMSPGGSFDHLVVGQELAEGWKRHHAY